MLNTEGEVGFVRAELNFEPKNVKLVSEIDVTGSPFNKVIKLTSMSQANQTGKIEVVLALDPNVISYPPSGNIHVAKIVLGSNIKRSNLKTWLAVNNLGSQVVGVDTGLYSISSTDVSIVVNQTAVSTSTPTASSTPESGPSCKSCFKAKCDNVCDSKREGASCLDCI